MRYLSQKIYDTPDENLQLIEKEIITIRIFLMTLIDCSNNVEHKTTIRNSLHLEGSIVEPGDYGNLSQRTQNIINIHSALLKLYSQAEDQLISIANESLKTHPKVLGLIHYLLLQIQTTLNILFDIQTSNKTLLMQLSHLIDLREFTQNKNHTLDQLVTEHQTLPLDFQTRQLAIQTLYSTLYSLSFTSDQNLFKRAAFIEASKIFYPKLF